MAKVAIVTAAGKGIGAACAKYLSDAGYRLAVMSRSDDIIAFAESIDGLAVKGSVTKKEDLDHLVKTTYDIFGRVDALVNNTGHPAKGELLELEGKEWHQGLDLLLLNVHFMAQAVTPLMIRQLGGAFVNISTFAAFEPKPSFPISSVLRASLASYAKLYADRFASQGIRMNNVLPGFMDSYPVADSVLKEIPMARSGRVEEIAKTAGFLLSDDASYITGQNIRVDGGITRSI